MCDPRAPRVHTQAARVPVLASTTRVPAIGADVQMPIPPTAHLVIRSIVAAIVIAAASSHIPLPSRRMTVVTQHIGVFGRALVVLRFQLTADIQPSETPVHLVR